MTSQRRRIAYCSPVNPVGSGISDYSEELLPYLAQYVDITLVVDDQVRPSNQELGRHFAIERISRLPRLHRRQPFAAVRARHGMTHARLWQDAVQPVDDFEVFEVLHHGPPNNFLRFPIA